MSEIIDTASHKALVDKVIAYLAKQLPDSQQRLAEKYTRYYYANVDYGDLSERSVMDLAGAALNHWRYSYQRAQGEAKIRVYNPSYEEDGWQSTHTIIEISHDDMPFLVDTARMEITRHEIGIHLTIHPGCLKVKRDDQNHITELTAWYEGQDVRSSEAPIHIEIDRITDKAALDDLCMNLNTVLSDVRYVVGDWQEILSRLDECIDDLDKHPPSSVEVGELTETKAFLAWLKENHFTFLGCRDYELVGKGEKQALKIIEGTALGVHRNALSSKAYRAFSEMPEAVRDLMFSPQILIIAKTNTKASVHRSAYTDYIGIKRYNTAGELIGERRFIGLYTSGAYSSHPKNIPFLRHKVATVIKNSGLLPTGHSGKDLLNILETFPRDDLFQANTDELTELTLGILNLQERKRTRLFVRRDIYNRYVSCLVYLPRERFNTGLQLRLQTILEEAFSGTETDLSISFSESVLARLHFLVRVKKKGLKEYDVSAIEQRLIETVRLWRDDLNDFLFEFYGEEKGLRLAKRYFDAFPSAYSEAFVPRAAVADINHIEKLSDDNSLEMLVYTPFGVQKNRLRLKIFRVDHTIPLSDAIPIFENMGLRVIDEHPYEIKLPGGRCVWINDFDMSFNESWDVNMVLIKENFLESFSKVWFAQIENDPLNQLILAAQLDWRAISMLRALAKYLRQINFNLSQTYIEHTFARYPNITKGLVNLFYKRFDPQFNLDKSHSAENFKVALETFESDLDVVEFLDEDRIFRIYLALIQATVRTNYFQEKAGSLKSYISFKFEPDRIPDMPLPYPRYEIFVYSPDFEGVHLRLAKVARGGLRWSDRREDFRTEVLGLMKAQQVKNSVIVPAGAKGGFFPKRLPETKDRSAIMENTIACYQNFIRGLLDLTDNWQEGKVLPPPSVVRYDDDDPYLVVAADKGTASFSDIANEITKEYDFWLGDAFASGGSVGYDHKKMGITAKGAWESVKRHFRSLDMNIQEEDFTVVGIGDMSGDVFGNGMLLSEHIRLVAAFNHLHIFIDPNPNAKVSFSERQRLFNLPRSSWADYNETLISQGGGVFSRKDKYIRLTPEIQELLGISESRIIPDELIRAILQAQIDLLWNGGIGTYVKASYETHLEVGDKANDSVRVDADELHCKVIGEGGNLGLTQFARIEYSLNHGYIYTDFIDNSAGVDCSDHEVNLKILFNNLLVQGALSEIQRNRLLKQMTNEVSALVLSNNYRQTQAIELSLARAQRKPELFIRYIHYLEEQGILNRELENLPSDKELSARQAAGLSLTRPELSVLVSYSKIILKQQILVTDIPEDDYFVTSLLSAFPASLDSRHQAELINHRLHREIVATQISNDLVNRMGGAFVFQLIDETGCPIEHIIRAFMISNYIFSFNKLWREIELLHDEIGTQEQIELLFNFTRLLRRITRWLLRNRLASQPIQVVASQFADEIRDFYDYMPDVLNETAEAWLNERTMHFQEQGLSESLAYRLAASRLMYPSLDIVQAAQQNELAVFEMARFYFAVGHEFNLDWLREQLRAQTADSHWDALALSAFHDDLDYLQQMLALTVLKFSEEHSDPADRIQAWVDHHSQLVERWGSLIANIRTSGSISMVILFVGLRELTDLARNVSANQERYSEGISYEKDH